MCVQWFCKISKWIGINGTVYRLRGGFTNTIVSFDTVCKELLTRLEGRQGSYNV